MMLADFEALNIHVTMMLADFEAFKYLCYYDACRL